MIRKCLDIVDVVQFAHGEFLANKKNVQQAHCLENLANILQCLYWSFANPNKHKVDCPPS